MKQIRLSVTTLLLSGTCFFTSCNKTCTSPTTIKINVGADQRIVLPANTTSVTAIISSGLTANTSFLWTALSGPNRPTFSNNTGATTTVSNLILGTYLLQVKATNNAQAVGLDTMRINCVPRTIIIQPTITNGQDAEVVYVPGLYDGTGLYGTDSVLRVEDWTFNGTEGWTRSYIKFTALNNLPAGTIITSAKLSLYGLNATTFSQYGTAAGDSYYPGSPYPLPNPLWLQRVLANWDQSTINYLNQPAVTTVDEVAVPASTSRYSYNVIDLDVTHLIQDMINVPGTNFGFSLRLQTEQYYRGQGFYSSESSNGPKLVITY